MENGESVPTIEKMVFLAELYEVSLDELVGIRLEVAFLLKAFLFCKMD